MHRLQQFVADIGETPGPLTVFFRDDDVGWGNNRLEALCERFGNFDIALDLAVIPAALDGRTESLLAMVLDRHDRLLHLHQHGYTHTNHQPFGRKCEFGPDRSAAAQLEDIVGGRRRLLAAFGERVEPLFTPPWNRCTSATCEVLSDQGFTGLSRIAGSDDIELHGLREVSVAVDWHKSHAGERLGRDAFFRYAAERFSAYDCIGIMLHHELMDDEELDYFSSFLESIRQSARVRLRSMIDLVENNNDRGERREAFLT